MSLELLSAGTQTTIQDSGRLGWREIGVSLAGAADAFSLALANAVLGNAESAAALELTWSGANLRAHASLVLALGGAGIHARVQANPVPLWRPLALRAGAVLSLGAITQGARCYVCVAGGLAGRRTLGSLGTDLVAGLGGLEGRALRAGDRIGIEAGASPHGPLLERAQAAPEGFALSDAWLAPPPHLPMPRIVVLRCLPGTHEVALDSASRTHLLEAEWEVGSECSRMGLKLTGPVLGHDAGELVSEPIAIGTVQLPPNGQPIVLGVEAQTVGGYPRIAHVIRADWPRIGQLRPGNRVRFVFVTQSEARSAWLEQVHWLARVREAVAQRNRRL